MTNKGHFCRYRKTVKKKKIKYSKNFRKGLIYYTYFKIFKSLELSAGFPKNQQLQIVKSKN